MPDTPHAETVVPALEIRLAEDERGSALDFTWRRALPAAFLIRAGHLWSVFAAPDSDPVGLPTVFPSPLPGHLGPGELVDAAGGQSIRFALRRPLMIASVERDEARWRVVFGPARSAPQAVPLERTDDPERLLLVAGEAVNLVHLPDPEVGDELVIWPLLAAGRGQPTGRRLVDLELLPTAQGLAWRARSDDLLAQAGDGAVEFSAANGLHLSTSVPAAPPEDPAAGAPARPPATRASSAAAPPERWMASAPKVADAPAQAEFAVADEVATVEATSAAPTGIERPPTSQAPRDQLARAETAAPSSPAEETGGAGEGRAATASTSSRSGPRRPRPRSRSLRQGGARPCRAAATGRAGAAGRAVARTPGIGALVPGAGDGARGARGA